VSSRNFKWDQDQHQVRNYDLLNNTAGILWSSRLALNRLAEGVSESWGIPVSFDGKGVRH
jgi:hypothetical protein